MQAYTSPRRFCGFLGSNKVLAGSLGVVVAAVIILTGFFYNRHEVRILADGKEINLIMRGGTVSDALKKAKVLTGERDIVEPALNTVLKEDSTIRIVRMVQVNVVADGKVIENWTPIVTVEQVLRKLNIALNPTDQVEPELKKTITARDIITVTRFSDSYITTSDRIPYRVERKNDNSMERGTTRVMKKGQDGIIQKTVKVTMKNGQEIKREVINEKVIQQPVNKVIAVGTVSVKTVSRGGSIKFSRVVAMSSTAYSHTGRNTASGIYPYRGAVAVDPRIIPLGTKLYIEGYGYAKALDIGSSIKGNRIDVFFDTDREAIRWGRRSVKVYILE